MSLPEDELRKGLPQAPNTTGSPALAGQPQSITGQAAALPTPETSSPASPSGGIASVESAPLSQGRTNESQGGAGDSLSQTDLVKDRGTPMQYMQKLHTDLGPDKVMKLVENSASKAKRAMKSDPELGGVQAGRMADEMGLTNDKKGVAGRAEMENMFGNMNDRTVDAEVDAKKISKNQGKKKKKKYRGAFAGMSREEFSMFLWDWGASMMANGEEGWGAVGVASGSAMAGHRTRIKEDQASELAATETARKTGLEERGMVAEEQRALAGMGVGETMDTTKGILEKQADGSWKPLTDEKGDPYKKDWASSRGYQGEKSWLANRYREQGLDEDTINDLVTGAKNPSERSQILQDQIGELRNSFKEDADGKPYEDYTNEDAEDWILAQMQAADSAASRYSEGKALSRALERNK